MQLQRLDMRADADFLRALDDWRRHEEDIPSRSEAVRRLVLIGIEASRRPAAVPPAAVSPPPRARPAEKPKKPTALPDMRPWREQRGDLRRKIVAHPGWAAIRHRDGLNTAQMSSRADFRPICAELGIVVPALDD